MGASRHRVSKRSGKHGHDLWSSTTYILDTATPLTMLLSSTRSVPTTSGNVLSTSTTRYWHGLVMKSDTDFITLAQSDGTTTQYFAYDGLGSVRQLVDTSGSVGLAQTFDPYGNGYARAGSAQSTLGYSGEQTDSNGFVFLRARYYQPGMGRFTQMDPSRQERNAYLYSYNNPVNYVDLSGLSPESPTKEEGKEIHILIDTHFLQWNGGSNRLEVEFPIREATKEGLIRTTVYPNYIVLTPGPNWKPNQGEADLVDLGNREM